MDLFDTTFVQGEPWRTRSSMRMFSSHRSFLKRYACIDCRICLCTVVCLRYRFCVLCTCCFDENVLPFIFSG